MAADTEEPAWLTFWRAGQLSLTDALRRFDCLSSVTLDDVVGQWRGKSLPTGHPLDRLLEGLGWYGKAFESLDRVHPLLFCLAPGHVVPVEPALMPLHLALRWPALAHSRATRIAFRVLLPALRGRRHAARLRTCDFRGQRSAAMIYAGQPIIDHFRHVDADRLIGLMEHSGMQRPFFFLLTRDGRN